MVLISLYAFRWNALDMIVSMHSVAYTPACSVLRQVAAS
jgi:hypothetical protein